MQLFALRVAIAVVALAATAMGDESQETVEVNPPVGPVRGSVMTSRLGKKIYSFRGVRFAEPPVGDLRFQPPVPIAPWKDVFDATQEGPAAPQIAGEMQSEDCLRLNVYTTKLPATNSSNAENPKRPVIVYFHPGAFYVFTAQSFMVGPQYIMDQDIVLVTVNYRLGTLGWAATGDAQASGNQGLKDQVVALRWVQKNIATFGGDPNCVTIAGYSAGSWSVVLHMVSPMTKGLFHRAIAMSGSPIYANPLPTHQIDVLKKQAEIMGCPTDTVANMLACLKTKDAIEMGESLRKFQDSRGRPMLIWTPVVEPDIPGVERYLTDQPANLMRQGKMHSVPLITGNTRDEFSGAVMSMITDAAKGDSSSFKELNDEWEKYAPILVGYEEGTEKSRNISQQLRKMYFKHHPIDVLSVDTLSELYRDILGFSGHVLATLMGQYSKKPVYYYEFTYQGRYTYGAIWSSTKKPYGVAHHDDLLYLFYNPWFKFPYFEPNDPEFTMVQRMTAMWANFAKTGEPIPCDNPEFRNIIWTPFTPQNKKYMDIGEEFILMSNFRGKKMDQWDQIFPLVNPEPSH